LRARLSHPFERLTARARRRALFVLAALAFALMLALASLDAGLRTKAAPNGIVSFEFAGDAATAGSMLEAWGEAGRARAERILWLDFLFLATYAPGLSLLCAAASDRERARGSRLANAGAALAWGLLLAGVLDAIENLALVRTLNAAEPGLWPALAAACAWPKFALVAAGLLYVAASVLNSHYRSRYAR
jgi:hypothetical protein